MFLCRACCEVCVGLLVGRQNLTVYFFVPCTSQYEHLFIVSMSLLVLFLDFDRQTPEGDVDEACVALAGIRRSLIFPYLRVWQLGALVVKDVGDILRAGKRCILRCLLQVGGVVALRFS